RSYGRGATWPGCNPASTGSADPRPTAAQRAPRSRRGQRDSAIAGPATPCRVTGPEVWIGSSSDHTRADLGIRQAAGVLSQSVTDERRAGSERNAGVLSQSVT